MRAGQPGESREPWVKIKVGLERSDKVGQLPNAAARWGWTRTLLQAKTQRRMGIFGSRRHLRDLLGAEGRYVGDFIAVGLAHEVPLPPKKGERPEPWCASGRCQKDYADAKSGEVVVHDYRREQRDPTNADRQARHRAGERDDDGDDQEPLGLPEEPPPPRPSNGGGNANSNALDNAPSNGAANGPVTPEVTGYSRARGTTATVTVTTRDSEVVPLGQESARATGNPSNEPRLTKREFDAWAGYERTAWGPFRAAWTARGFRLPPKGGEHDDQGDSLRSMLWQIADAWPDALGEWVRAAPGRTTHEIVAYVLEQWHAIRADAGVEDPEWAETKAAERQAASTAMSRIGALLTTAVADLPELDFDAPAGTPRDAARDTAHGGQP